MIDLTPDARQRFDEYLRRMRSALRGTRVEAGEIEQNVLEHVELALAGVPSPVGPEPLRAVLDQLGPPERWLPDDERPWWTRLMERLTQGPEDWRLAYLSFAITFLMLISFPIGGVLLLVPAFILSRAYVALAEDRGERLGAKAWLVVPPIVFALLLFLAAAFFLVPGSLAAIASEREIADWGFPHRGDQVERVRNYIGVVSAATGAWWIVVASLFALLFRPLRWFFAPTLQWVSGRIWYCWCLSAPLWWEQV
jgi:hypothetical protein